MRRMLFLALAVSSFGCEDEPEPPPNQPGIKSVDARCRQIEGTFKLDSITVVIEDLDGVDDLEAPKVVVETTELEMEIERLTTMVEECATDACQIRYTWNHSRDSEQIYCGDDGTLLEVNFEIFDIEGFPARAFIPTKDI